MTILVMKAGRASGPSAGMGRMPMARQYKKQESTYGGEDHIASGR
jgi:hypothetical protein